MILILNGPNLNMLGRRDPAHYGSETLDSINTRIENTFEGVDFEFRQSNSEGEIIDILQEYGHSDICGGIVINPGAYSHYSHAIADALRDIKLPKVEVHLSNIFDRDQWRQQSVTAPACDGVIAGLGAEGYILAVAYITGKN